MIPKPDGRQLGGQRQGGGAASDRRRLLLPFHVPATVVGFVLINSSTFGLDLALLTLLHGVLGIALAVAVTISYVAAFAVSYVLNRKFNFRSHGPVGKQLVIYAVAVGINYAAFILGVTTGLTSLGVEYHVSRVAAGLCEGVFMYSVLRWVVFRTS